MNAQTERFCLLIRGQVQGVGFRPWVFRTAHRWPLTGFVRNDTSGVSVEAQGRGSDVEALVAALRRNEDAPPLARIAGMESSRIPVVPGERSFVIDQSDASGAATTGVTPDAAVCADCLGEMHHPGNFRHRYPFINCTNCGPRYTIIKSVPYDRPNTTMAAFAMCGQCRKEYSDVGDRRFHAQPVACPECGPHLSLVVTKQKQLAHGDQASVKAAARLLLGGSIMAIKGIGGFHLAADARNEQAVRLLRERKHRECKPLAMMAASIETVRACAEVSPQAESILSSPESPIVLVPQKAGSAIAASVAPGTNTFGFMLPYAPLHHLLFDEVIEGRRLEALVMTSANIAEEPLICRNDEALAKLGGIADCFLMHDRDIHRQLDDSIVHFVNHAPVPLRRARGYVPAPVFCGTVSSKRILAAGSDLKNTFCLARGGQFIVSEHIGDLENADVYRHYQRSVRHLCELFDFKPELAAADLHPGYFSTQFARSLAPVELMEVQHHWAHIASVLAEHDTAGPVIGIAADGTGYGTDGAVWGCECLIASLEDFSRFAHLKYFPLAGGDRASREPVRPLVALLAQAFGDSFVAAEHAWCLERLEPDARKLSVIIEQVRKGVNAVPTSSLGRVFDAAAAMLGLGNYNHFEAQLPIALEAAADAGCHESYAFELIDGSVVQLDLGPMFRAMLADVKAGQPVSVISGRFHNTLAAAFAAMALKARRVTGIGTVALSGGVFCNRLLAGKTINVLQKNGFVVLYNTAVPANDGGLSLGQAAIAAHRFRK